VVPPVSPCVRHFSVLFIAACAPDFPGRDIFDDEKDTREWAPQALHTTGMKIAFLFADIWYLSHADNQTTSFPTS